MILTKNYLGISDNFPNMNNYSIFCLLLMCAIFSSVSNVSANNPNCELYINNRISGKNLYIRFYPVDAIFNGDAHSISQPTKYSLFTIDYDGSPNSGVTRKLENDSNDILHLVGLDGYALENRSQYPGYYELKPDTGGNNYDKWLLLGHDASQNSYLDGLFGYGRYQLEIYHTTDEGLSFQYIVGIPIDWLDFNYPNQNSSHDLFIRIYSLSPLMVTFQWAANINGEELPLFGTGSPPHNGGIQVYKQYHRFVNGQWQGYNLNGEHPPSRGNSASDKYYLSYPIDGRDLPAPYTIPRHDSSGSFFGNLTIDTSISTMPELHNEHTELIFNENTFLRINTNDTLTLATPELPSAGNVSLIMKQASRLSLAGTLVVEDRNVLRLKSNSAVRFFPGSAIVIRQGAVFCNEGAEMDGPPHIYFSKGMHLACENTNDIANTDSATVVLDSATLSFPDNFTLHLKGKETALIVNPGSKLLFGENSGIVCDSGARLIANDATFSSVDSTKKWNGILLSGPSNDTVRNCKIKNAAYGIVLSGKYDPNESPEQYSTEISGCSFENHTSYVFNSAVYLQNSAHVLLKDNAITSSNLSIGFTHGIYAEYCPGEMLNFMGNNISNCNNGMTIIQSSPYIAFNTLNGNSYGESGIFLDNSNGKIKYNVISDFYYSYYSFYSSPDLLKNTFDNTCDDNIYLSSSSVPVMRPLLSGGSTYWLAGDNLITGSPSDAGILFNSDAMPDLNYGYNRFVLQGSSYYINGVNPTGGTRDFYAVKNYWHDDPPDSSKFIVTNALSVFYSPYDNNSTSARATNNHQLDSIGFGLYDTLHFYESDNPNSAQELYLLAYQSEFNGKYDVAIGYYKEIVSDYSDSSNASSCLARIFNCYEKKQATVTEYALLENYFLAIAADTAHSVIMRNVSEDLAIQSNIKQGNIEEAISDYDEIYANNTNTPKGFHALINKEILSAGEGDNLNSGSTFDEIEFKQIKINALLKGLNTRDAKANFSTNSNPLDFSLSQNFPNPFNPSTTIRFDIRTSGNVSLKVYDILGREVAVLADEHLRAGSYERMFEASNLSSGVYFYTLRAVEFVKTLRMVVVR